MEINTKSGPVFRPGNFEITDKAVSFCSFRSGAKILDIGCGSGATVQYLTENYSFDVFGIDKHYKFTGEQINLAAASGEEIPFKDEYFDGITMECSFTVMENQASVLNECRRVLKPDGYLMISGIYARREAAQFTGCIGLIEKKETLAQKIENNGFMLKQFEDFTHMLQTYWGQLILNHGAKNFYCSLGINPEVLKKVKCGYFLIIAQKR